MALVFRHKFLVEDVVFRFPCIVFIAVVLPFNMIKYIAFFVVYLSNDAFRHKEVVVELLFGNDLNVMSVLINP